jgi:hypothetical protein
MKIKDTLTMENESPQVEKTSVSTPGLSTAPTPPGETPPTPPSETAPAVSLPRRRVGRPTGSATKRKGATQPSTAKVAVKAENIKAAHMIIALATGCPELTIGDTEAKMLEGAVNDFIAAYPELAIVSPKIAATITLLTTAVIVYAPRVMKIRARVTRKNAGQTPHVAAAN